MRGILLITLVAIAGCSSAAENPAIDTNAAETKRLAAEVELLKKEITTIKSRLGSIDKLAVEMAQFKDRPRLNARENGTTGLVEATALTIRDKSGKIAVKITAEGIGVYQPGTKHGAALLADGLTVIGEDGLQRCELTYDSDKNSSRLVLLTGKGNPPVFMAFATPDSAVALAGHRNGNSVSIDSSITDGLLISGINLTDQKGKDAWAGRHGRRALWAK